MIRTPQKELVLAICRKYGSASLILRVRLGFARPARKLGQPRPGRTARRIQVADNHVVKQNVVQTPRSQLAAHQVRVHIKDRHVGQFDFQLCLHCFTQEESPHSRIQYNHESYELDE